VYCINSLTPRSQPNVSVFTLSAFIVGCGWMMVSLRHTVGWLLGLVGLVLSLLTLICLILMLSTQRAGAGLVSEDVPCCGRYVRPLLWNLGLLALFILQHSGMASDVWKTALNQVGADLLHRPLYVICSCAVLLLMVFHTAALPGPALWYFDADDYPTLWLAVSLLHGIMWFVIVAGAVAAEPMELIGLKQLYYSDNHNVLQNDSAADKGMNSRHIGVLAFVVILWVHMAMSVERFLLAMTWTLYLLFGCHSSPFVIYIIPTQKKQT